MLTREEVVARFSAISTDFLWCVHVIGPDDLHPVRTYQEAVDQSDKHNSATLLASEQVGVVAIAVPALWPWSRESHRAALAKEAR